MLCPRCGYGAVDPPKTKIGWLIELNDTNKQDNPMLDYWAGSGATPDAIQAVRFSRREDADKVLAWLLRQGPICSPNGTATVREHMFYGA